MSVDLKGRVECQRVIYIHKYCMFKKKKKKILDKENINKKSIEWRTNFFVN